MGRGLLMAYGIPLAIAVAAMAATRMVRATLVAAVAVAVGLATYAAWVALA